MIPLQVDRTIYAFTGPEEAPSAVVEPLRSFLRCLPEPDGVITGAAHGIDTYAADIAFDLWPQAQHTVIVPDFRHNAMLVSRMATRGAQVIYMPKGTSPLDRNREMIALATHLIALPATEREILRSGTWATVRAARKRGLPIKLASLEALC